MATRAVAMVILCITILVIASVSSFIFLEWPLSVRASILLSGSFPALAVYASHHDWKVPTMVGIFALNGGIISGVIAGAAAKVLSKGRRFWLAISVSFLLLALSGWMDWILWLLLHPGT
jgi:hypothetical protein